MSDGVTRTVSDSEKNQIIAADYLHGSGQTGFKRLDQSDVLGGSNEYDAANHGDNEISYIKAINAEITFDAGCTAKRGDAPASGDVLAQGDILSGPLTKVVISAGVALVYTKSKLADN